MRNHWLQNMRDARCAMQATHILHSPVATHAPIPPLLEGNLEEQVAFEMMSLLHLQLEKGGQDWNDWMLELRLCFGCWSWMDCG
jgi:hypothetical protein